VIDASQSWAHRHNRTVTYVYLLLPGINDTPTTPDDSSTCSADAKARINLMRWNPVLGGDTYQRIDDHGLTSFKRRLENRPPRRHRPRHPRPRHRRRLRPTLAPRPRYRKLRIRNNVVSSRP
jgi:adenine C2-methylase RlmN of 23S rRNA A2503 and tRNA A37